MAKMYKYSRDAVIKSLNIFYTPPTNTSIKSVRIEHIDCDSQINGKSLIWQLDQGGVYYYDLTKIRLQLVCRITSSVGNMEPPADEEDSGDVGPINHLLRTMWKNIKVEMGNKTLSTSDDDFHYKSYIKTLLYEVQDEGMVNKLQPELFYTDIYNNLDHHLNEVGRRSNLGYVSRVDLTKHGREFMMEGSLGEDVLTVKNKLINGVKLKVTLTRADDDFVLFTTAPEKKYKLEIVKAVMKLPVVEVGPAIITGHHTGLQEGGLGQYFFKQTSLARHEVGREVTTCDIKLRSNELIPNRIVVAFVSDARYDGDYLLNPFVFEHLYVKKMVLNVSGRKIPAGDEIYDFEMNSYAPLVNNLHDVAKNSIISYNAFGLGYTLFVFNINTTEDDYERLMLQHYGNVSLSISFARPTPAAGYKALIYSEFQSCIQVDETRKIKYSGDHTA